MKNGATRPLSVRLTMAEIEALKMRARRVSGAPSAVARDLLRASLAGGDAAAQATRLLMIERRLAAIDQQVQAIRSDEERQAATLARLASMFEALLGALAGDQGIVSEGDDRDD